MRSKKTTILAISIVTMLSILYASNAAAILQIKPEIQENDIIWEHVAFGETEAVPFTVKTAGNVSIWLLTPTEFAALILENGSYQAPLVPADLNSIANGTLSNGLYIIQQQWNVAFVNVTYGLPIQYKLDANGRNRSTIYIHLLVQNHGPGAQRVMIQLKPEYEFIADLEISLKWLMIFFTAALVIWLLWSGHNASMSEEKKHKTKMYYSFGVGFGFGLVARVIGETAHYYDRDIGLFLFPQNRLQGSIAGVIFNSAASTAIPSVLFVMMLSLAFVGFSYIVEKIVKNRKPVFTVNLIIAAAVAPLMLFLPAAWTDIILAYTIGSILLAFANVLLVYMAVARNASGDLRRQAIFTMVGILIPVIFQVFDAAISFGTFPMATNVKGIVFSSLVVVGLWLFYKSKV